MKGLSFILVVAYVALAHGDDRCPPDQESNWEIEKLLEHEDCHKFYQCTFGKPVERTCPDGLYFNLETWKCDWMQNVYCGDRNDPAYTTQAPPQTDAPITAEPETEPPVTTIEPTTAEPTTPEPTTPEPTTPEPTTPEPTTPEPTTPEPTTPEPTTPEPTTPEPTTPEPTTPEPTTTPEPETEPPTTTEAPTPEPEPETEAPEPEKPEIEFQENGCPVDPHIHWLLPHEDDCNLFYYCVWGEKVLRQCPASLHFNRVLQVCDWPLNAGCVTSFDKHIIGRRLMSQLEASRNL